MMNNSNDFISRLDEWKENQEFEQIIRTIVEMPENEIDDELLLRLADAYVYVGDCKQAIAVLEGQRERMENHYQWQFCMLRALYLAANDEECQEDETLRHNILRKAKVAAARTMTMNPPEDIMEQTSIYVELVEIELHGGLDKDSEDSEDDEDFEESYEEYGAEDDNEEYGEDVELYDEDELDVVENHIQEHFGDFPTVFHEIVSPDIHCDVYVISPTEENNFYTLCTVGMGAHIMSLPDDLDSAEFGRAELFITLPPEWKVGDDENQWFWPVGLIKGLARLPINNDTWLGWGHTIDNQSNFADNTQLCGSILLNPVVYDKEASECVLPNGDKVNFYQVIPLYRDEMEYKIEHGADGLMDLFQKCNPDPVLDITRPDVCEVLPLENDEGEDESFYFDNVALHNRSIAEKNLPLDPIVGCNHIAIFLRWCIEHDEVSPELYEVYPHIVEGVKDKSNTDLRQFIIDEFDGKPAFGLLSFAGACFCKYYYNRENPDAEYFYPRDVDSYAEKYFGTEEYNSEKFQDEAYLFVPFDEDYYRGLSEYIDRAFASFYSDFVEDMTRDTEQYIDYAEQLLGCECNPVLPKEIGAGFIKSSEKKGVYPVVLIIDYEGSVRDEDSLCDILDSGSIPFLELVTVAEFPCSTVNELAVMLRDVSVSGEPIALETASLNKYTRRLSEKFGTSQIGVVSFNKDNDEIPSGVFIHLEGGQYFGFRLS